MAEQRSHMRKVKDLTNHSFSPTFCFAKWYHTTIYLQTGETHSCYHPAPHKINVREIKENPSALHNTQHKKQERRDMLEGKQCNGCNYCWNVENMDGDYVSDRNIRSASIYTDDRLKEVTFNKWDFDVNPEYIEISFGNECNFRCGYCHPKASSRYYNEIKQHGPYTTVKNHRNDIDWFQVYEEDSNPYLDAWWKWWPEVSKTLNILRVTGGEPTIQKSTYRLFDELENNPKPHLDLNVNSNLGGKPKQLAKFTDCVNSLLTQKKIKNFELFTSVDTWDPRAEYIRDGLNLEVFERNLDYFMRNTTAPVTFMITFSLFSVTTFQTLLEKILEWRKKYNDVESTRWNRILFDTPYLKEPLQYDINILPKDEYMPYMESHLQFIKDNMNNDSKEHFSEIEYEKFRRVVDYMRTTEYPDYKLEEGRRDFWNFFTEQDRRRNISVIDSFPEMNDFIMLCKETNEV
jgi:pyruvate-formate lyase-activating enzyme